MGVTLTGVVLCLRMDAGGDREVEDGGDGLSAVHDWSASIQRRFLKSGIIRNQVCVF